MTLKLQRVTHNLLKKLLNSKEELLIFLSTHKQQKVTPELCNVTLTLWKVTPKQHEVTLKLQTASCKVNFTVQKITFTLQKVIPKWHKVPLKLQKVTPKLDKVTLKLKRLTPNYLKATLNPSYISMFFGRRNTDSKNAQIKKKKASLPCTF